jgi:hypothetical protein
MNNEKYYIIADSENGLDVQEVSKEELLGRLTPENGETYYGDIEILEEIPEVSDGHFHTNNDKKGVIIIKGKIIKPKEKKVVLEYEVE